MSSRLTGVALKAAQEAVNSEGLTPLCGGGAEGEREAVRAGSGALAFAQLWESCCDLSHLVCWGFLGGPRAVARFPCSGGLYG